MTSVLTSVVASSESTGRFPAAADVMSPQVGLSPMVARLEAAEKLSAQLDQIAEDAYAAGFWQYLQTGSQIGSQIGKEALDSCDASGKAAGSDRPVKQAKCLRDIKHYLRLVSYSLVVGSTDPLDDWGIADVREVYRALNLPTAPYVAALQYTRDHACGALEISPQALVEFRALLNYVIDSLA